MTKTKKVLTFALATCLTLGSSLPGLAVIDKHVTEEDGKSYEYEVSELSKSIFDQLRGGKGLLINNYNKQILKAVHDDKTKEYISKENIDKAIFDSLREGKDFKINDYTESKETETIKIDNVTKVTEKDGEIVEDAQKQKCETLLYKLAA